MKKGLVWKRARLIIRPDNIMSSQARETGDRGFIPKYEMEPHVKMGFLMSNEYMRQWYEQRDFHVKDTIIRELIKAEETAMRRRHVQRLMPVTRKPKEKHMPIIQLRKFQNVAAKVEHRRTTPSSPVCSKYLRTVEELENLKYKPDCPSGKGKEKMAGAANI